MLAWALAYLAVVNAATFVLFASDKRRALSGERRVPERTLLGWAAAGGLAGAFAAQRVLRHKTRKEPFRTQLLTIALAQAALAAGAWWLFGRG